MKDSDKFLNFDRLNRERIFTYGITFLLYTGVHSTRSAWSISKPYLPVDKSFLGLLDFFFLFTYGLSMQFGGSMGDRIPVK